MKIIALIFFSVITLGASHCGHPMPVMNITFWPGDYQNDRVVDKQGNRTMSCRDIAFDNGAWISYQDIEQVYNTMLQCKDWGTTTLSSTEALRFANMLRK